MSQYPKLYARPGDFDPAHYREQWSLILNNGGRATLAKVACYMRERLRYRDRWEAVLKAPGIPVSAIWGRLDPIAVAAIANRLLQANPQARLLMLDDTGHYPQLEAPSRVSEEIIAFAGGMT